MYVEGTIITSMLQMETEMQVSWLGRSGIKTQIQQSYFRDKICQHSVLYYSKIFQRHVGQGDPRPM